VLVFLLPVPVHAQAVRPACELEDLDGFFSGLEVTNAAFRQARMLGDLNTILQLIDGLDATIQGVKTACNPLRYNNEADGQQAVIGPVSIGPGSYLATAVTDGALLVEITVESGICDPQVEGPLFELEAGEASEGSESLFISRGCTVLISVSESAEPWTLDIQRIR
jgi:hypothetical protein